MDNKISMIAAVTEGSAIGRAGDMIYHIGGDLRHFKELTMGHPVIMGRKTWQSLPAGPLPGRLNIVVSRDEAYSAPGAETADSLDEALLMTAGQEPFIIGGAQMYAQGMYIATDLYITEINAPSPDDADTFFPRIDPAKWTVADTGAWLHDDRAGVDYRYVHYTRKTD